MYFIPKTPTGKKAMYFFFLFAAASVLSTVVSRIMDNQIEYPNPLNSPLLGTLIYLTFILAGIAFVYTVKAFWKSRDRAWILVLSAVVSGWFAFTGVIFFVAVILLVLGFTL